LPLLHNPQSTWPYLHFPWANNSCALDATLTAYWIIHQRENFVRSTFADEYPKIHSIFHDLHNGLITNIAAKDLFELMFDIDDENYKHRHHVETELVHKFIQNHLRVDLIDHDDSTFNWIYTSDQICPNCDKNLESKPGFMHTQHCLKLPDVCTTSSPTVQKSINDIFSDINFLICESCNVNGAMVLETIKYPNVLHIVYAPPLKNCLAHTPLFLQQEIILNNEIYDIVGAVYGDNTHFIFRYLCNGKVYEADGMGQHTMSTRDDVKRVAQSVLIDEQYELAMAGRIGCKMRKKIKVGGKQVVDVFYIKR
jgi:hypothetical protein